MMKKQKSKEMSGEEPASKTKAPPSPHQTPTKIRCIRNTDMPFVGLFEGGDIIDDPKLIEAIGSNPNFEKFSEEA